MKKQTKQTKPLKRRSVNKLTASLTALGVAAFGVYLVANPNLFGASAGTSTVFPKTAVSSQVNLITAGQWTYMPATMMAADGLHVDYRNFKIVEQDGSGGQPNPAVNEYGTHLQVPSNGFLLGSNITGISGSFSLQLYATAPKVSDEF